jgi:ribosomal protein L37E
MIRNVTIPAIECTCERCGYEWVSIAKELPEACPSRRCRTREWNGKKGQREPGSKIELPKPMRVRGGEEDEF